MGLEYVFERVLLTSLSMKGDPRRYRYLAHPIYTSLFRFLLSTCITRKESDHDQSIDKKVDGLDQTPPAITSISISKGHHPWGQ